MSNLMAGQTLDSGQLDLFVHSRAVILANDTINALLAREAAQASACLGRLGAEVPDYGALNALETLSRALSEWPLRSTSPAEIAVAVGRLEGEVHPAALAAMGSKAADFMRLFWHDLAHTATLHAYDSAFPQSFCAGLYLRCGDTRAAARTAESIPEWERNTDALHWLASSKSADTARHSFRPGAGCEVWIRRCSRSTWRGATSTIASHDVVWPIDGQSQPSSVSSQPAQVTNQGDEYFDHTGCEGLSQPGMPNDSCRSLAWSPICSVWAVTCWRRRTIGRL
jgi:hypothetical protein